MTRPSDDFSDVKTADNQALRAKLHEARGRVRVVCRGEATSFPLPARGQLVIGRGQDADIQIDDADVSRRHALLIVGERLELEDLGSVNGTHLRSTRLKPGERAQLCSDEVVDVGPAMLVVQDPRYRERGPAPRPVTPQAAETVGPAHVVADPAMARIYDLLARIADSSLNVLLLGETGVGKQVLAERLHAASPRAERPFLQLNCATLDETLLESKLFGHVAGAFTGATGKKKGLLEVADGGTVFLDEIGEMPAATQAKLLRFIEDGQVLAVGGVTPVHVDVRFVSATHRDLESDRASFRDDLFYRLAGMVIRVPPLRERPGEIEPLAQAFATQLAAREGKPFAGFTAEARELLRSHPWPGNVRELRNAVERSVVLAGGVPVEREHVLPAGIAALGRRSTQPDGVAVSAGPAVGAGPSAGASAGVGATLRDAVDDAERARIQEALARRDGNQSAAARDLGISRSTLLRRLKELSIAGGRRAP